MTISWVFLGVAVYGALYTVNAYRPFRWSVGIVATFFASWLTSELAAHHLLWQALATVVFARLGAFSDWPGWLGLGITVASWAGLAGLVRQARRAEAEVEAALGSALGDGYTEFGLSRHTRPRPRGQIRSGYRLAVAFHFRRREVVRVRDIPYGPYGRRNLLDVYHHRDGGPGGGRRGDGRRGDGPAPVLLWVHGGAWIIGHKAQQALPMLNHMAASGWVCVSINYRLSPRARFPEHLVDVKRAIAWVKEHIAEYGGDPDFILLTGGSAGGHLTALAALTAGDAEYQPGFEGADTSVQACVPFYGVFDFTNRLGSRRPLDASGFRRLLERRVFPPDAAGDPDAFRRASPIDCVHAGAPPFLVIHGTHDVLAPVADAREFVHRLRGVSGQPVAYAELRGTQHAFDVFHSIRTTHVVRGVQRFGTWARARHLAAQVGVR